MHHSSSTNGLIVYVEKQPVARKECCVDYWCKKARKHMSKLNGRRDMTSKLLKTALNPNQSEIFQFSDQRLTPNN